MGLLQLAGLLIILRVLRDHFSPLEIIVFCGLFWLSPWRASKAILWNPSYLILVTALHLYSFHRLQQKPKAFWPSVLHVIALGIGIELHPSVAVLILLSGVLFLCRALPLNLAAAGLAVLLILLTLVPWLLAVSDETGLVPVVDEARGNFYYGFNLLHPFSFFKGVMYWVRYTSMVFPHYIFSNLDYSAFGAAGVLNQKGDAVYFRGSGATDEGDRPFLDLRSMETGETERVFRCAPGRYDYFEAFAGSEDRFVMRSESAADVPNYYLATLDKSIEAAEGEATRAYTKKPITRFEDPTPQLRQIEKRLVRYER